MKNKGLLILSGLTVLTLAAAGWAVKSRSATKAAVDSYGALFENLDVNAVAELFVQSADGAVTLKKEGEEWVLVERGGYPAKFEKVKETVVRATDLKIQEPKTSKPENFAKLGVEDPAGEDAESSRLVLRGDDGRPLAGVIVGDTKFLRSSQSVYVRRDGESQVYLCEGRLDVDADPKNWIERELVRLENDRVQEVRIAHHDGEEVLIGRDPENHTQFVVENLPPEREQKFAGVANGVATALSYLGLDDVRRVEDVDFTAEPMARTIFRCHDGLVLTIETAKFEELIWVKMVASYEAPPETVGPAPEDEEGGEAGEGGDTEDPVQGGEDPVEGGEEIAAADDEADADKVRAEVDEMNGRFLPWAFVVPEYKGTVIARRMAELLLEPEAEEPEPIEGPLDLDEVLQGEDESIGDESEEGDAPPVPDDPPGSEDG